MVPLQISFLKEENPSEETGGLALPVPFQLVHPSLDYQGNAFRGCDCHIEMISRSRMYEQRWNLGGMRP
jgi:hypothetical protein